MALRLSGQNCKVFKFLLSLNSQKRLRYKENAKYRHLTWKPQSHVRIVIYWTWPIANSGQTRLSEHAQSIVLYSQPIRFVRLEVKYVNCGLPVLDQPRGCDSWYWPKGAWALRTRILMIVAGLAQVTWSDINYNQLLHLSQLNVN